MKHLFVICQLSCFSSYPPKFSCTSWYMTVRKIVKYIKNQTQHDCFLVSITFGVNKLVWVWTSSLRVVNPLKQCRMWRMWWHIYKSPFLFQIQLYIVSRRLDSKSLSLKDGCWVKTKLIMFELTIKRGAS